ncbi:MAG: alpha/beta hydrolase [Gammaproteobacteria bacterium]|nr:alpha/beta hydrolase [Gammaproteobacteria bacterium]MXX30382.1 alpha/beta hydrolase [Gammaproteobacteria bacterium]MYE49974.1 alpha/beta hydrolase [Gammaproteobacteria bacterium]MYF11893.1 alpha/beta hydrolase [Gammaproteobacteria bacterium]MYF49614.1 alpha/beta hydrolase [Gammaproteobacteria bacterium]
MQFEMVENGGVNLRVASQGEGPVILCVHGWPELWYSWRHQMAFFAERGHRVAAMDVRGYGGSSKPHAIAAYTLRELAADVAAVARHLSDEPVILLGHDWGAPIVYASALLHPGAVRAVAGLSVPFTPPGPHSFLDQAERRFANRFFYQIYFQEEGVAEAELEADIPAALRQIYFALSGDAPADLWLQERPATETLLQRLEDPDPFPGWMTPQDLATYADAFKAGGFRGPLNRYRAQRLDPEQLTAVHGQRLQQPTCFIAGERDLVRHFAPSGDLYAWADAAADDFRGTTIVPGAGHWVQQEAPEAVNQALGAFIADVN